MLSSSSKDLFFLHRYEGQEVQVSFYETLANWIGILVRGLFMGLLVLGAVDCRHREDRWRQLFDHAPEESTVMR